MPLDFSQNEYKPEQPKSLEQIVKTENVTISPQLPQAPAQPQVTRRRFDDTVAARKAIFSKVVNTTRSLQPISNKKYELTISDPFIDKYDDYTPEDEKKAILEQKTLDRKLMGTINLRNLMTGEIQSRKMAIANIPYLTNDGTFLRGGVKYGLKYQSRLRPGIFTYIRRNGEYTTHINADMNDGPIHHYSIDPTSGMVYMNLSSTKTPLMPFLKALGATDEEIKQAWGDKLYFENDRKYNEKDITKYYNRFVRDRDKVPGADIATQRQILKAAAEKIKLDPDVMSRTLGNPYNIYNKDVALAASKKLINLAQGKVKPDDRDNLAFLELYGPEDLFAERIAKDTLRARRQLLNKITFTKGDVSKVLPGFLTKTVEDAILGSGLGQPKEQINRMELLDSDYSVSRMGVGGIPSVDSVPESTRQVNLSQRGFVDLVRTPESMKVGADLYFAGHAMKGSDNKLYAPFINTKTGKEEYLSPKDVSFAVTSVASEFNNNDKFVPAVKNGELQYVRREEVNYIIPNFENAFSPLANLIPFKDAIKGQRLAMASRMTSQALPLNDGEAPLVQTGVPDSDESYHRKYGTVAGAVFADQNGIVTKSTDTSLTVKYEDGTSQTYNLARYLPGNRKTYENDTANFKVGETFKKGDAIVRSNMTDKDGVVALGKNLRIAFLPWKGGNFEDGFVLSESAAKKMTSQHMYQNKMEWTDTYKRGKNTYLGMFPSKYEKTQMDNIDDNGIIKVGAVVQQNDPIMLACKEVDIGNQRVHKKKSRTYTDGSVLWEHEDPGVVTDIYDGKNGNTVVLIKTESPTKIGDKFSTRYGTKGVCSCYDSETEILTEHGWQYFKDITTSDKVAYLTEEGYGDFINPTVVTRSTYNGVMLGSKGNVQYLVTPNHNMLTPKGFVRADKIHGSSTHYLSALPFVSKFDKPANIVLSKYTDEHAHFSKNSILDANIFAKFIALYLRWGCSTEFKPDQYFTLGNSIMLQCANTWENVLNEIPGYTGLMVNEYYVENNYLYKYLQSFGHAVPKQIPEHFFSLHPTLLKVFIDSLFEENNEFLSFELELLNGIQRAASLAGVNTTIKRENNIYCLRKCEYTTEVKPEDYYKQEYHGTVYCVTVPTNTILVRRNGTTMWCGNSILPDHQMPQFQDGAYAEICIHPTATISRTNPAILLEALGGKIAKKTGKPIITHDFEGKDLAQYMYDLAEQNGVTQHDVMLDPETGRPIKNADGTGVMNGYSYIMKLHHSSEAKASARGFGAYSYDESPAKGGNEGAKRMSLSVNNALLSHGAINIMKDARDIRGQRNEDWWMQFMLGQTPPPSKIPYSSDKFKASLEAVGVHVVPEDGRFNIMALTDKNVQELAGNREIQNSETINWEKDKKPLKGGLFDPEIFGEYGDRWGYIQPVTPVLNPVFETPVLKLLDLTQKQFENIMSGQEPIGKYGTGIKGIYNALADINVNGELAKARAGIKTSKGNARDKLIRKVKYLQGAVDGGLHPKDWILNRLPILPPKFRSVAEMEDGTPLIPDSNYLYKNLIDTNNSLKELSGFIDIPKTADLQMYKAFKEVAGLADPSHPKLKQMQVQGILKDLFGGGTSSKFSTMQRSLLGTTVDLVGRSSIVADINLDMDSIGIPENGAWKVYKPFILRRLVKHGYPLSKAINMYEERTTPAREAMLHVMDVRPVLSDRAPLLHKFGIMAFRPKLVPGDSVHMNPFVCKGLGADFDGNCCDFNTEIFLQLSPAALNICGISAPSDWEKYPIGSIQRELGEVIIRLYGEEQVNAFLNGEVVKIKIGEFPRTGQPVKDKNGADVYSVPEGVHILSYDPKTGEPVWKMVKYYTVEQDKSCVEVKTSNDKSVIVSDNESLVAYNHETGKLDKIKADQDAIGRFVPVMRRVYCNNIIDKKLTRKEFLEREEPEDDLDVIPVYMPEILEASKFFNDKSKEYTFFSEICRKKTVTRKNALKYLANIDENLCPVLRRYAKSVDVIWERYESVTKVEDRDVFDLGVEDTKLYVIANGMVIYDTMNYHIPVSEEAVQEAYELMLPSKNLFQVDDLKTPYHIPRNELSFGIAMATDIPSDKPTKFFDSLKSAEIAYRRGEINLNDKIHISKVDEK